MDKKDAPHVWCLALGVSTLGFYGVHSLVISTLRG